MNILIKLMSIVSLVIAPTLNSIYSEPVASNECCSKDMNHKHVMMEEPADSLSNSVNASLVNNSSK